jgi:hypothetical protein
MLSYFAGVATGCLIGIFVSFILLLMSSVVTERNQGAQKSAFHASASAIIVVLVVALVCFSLNLGESISTLLLLLFVLAIAQTVGMATSLLATGGCRNCTQHLVLTAGRKPQHLPAHRPIAHGAISCRRDAGWAHKICCGIITTETTRYPRS